MQLLQRSRHDLPGQRLEPPGRFGERDEPRRRQHRPVRAHPARERFAPDDRAGLEVEHRLQVWRELAGGERPVELDDRTVGPRHQQADSVPKARPRIAASATIGEIKLAVPRSERTTLDADGGPQRVALGDRRDADDVRRRAES